MNTKTKELVGIAAAVAGHCMKCFGYHYNKAKKLGIENCDIKEAVEFAKSIRGAGDKGIDEYVGRLLK